MNSDDTADIVIQAHKICKSFETGTERLDVLVDIDFEIYRGEIVAILGTSGVGKSTFLHILGTLDRPTKGQLWIDSTDMFSLPGEQMADFRNRSIGFIFQAHHLLPEFTAVENVMMPMLIRRLDEKQAYEEAKQLLTEVGLEKRLTHKPGELSGGEQQRVSVARALVGRPLVVLADEPSGNLDRANRESLLDIIWNMSRSHQQAFVIVTHDEAIVGRRADRTFQLTDGHLNEINMESHS